MKSKSDKDVEKIEIYSPDIQEVIGLVPKWITRWGITLIFIVIFFFVTGSYFFKYPDIIPAEIEITSDNPPQRIIARSSGKIQELLVENGQQVDSGDVVAIIHNTAIYKDIITLQNYINKYLSSKEFSEIQEETPGNLQLGEIQSYYSNVIMQYEAYKVFMDTRFYEKKTKALKRELNELKYHKTQLINQKEINNRELIITYNQLMRDSLLFDEGFISKSQIENSEKIYLQKRKILNQSVIDISNTNLQFSRLNSTLNEIYMQSEKEQNQLETGVAELVKELKAKINNWEHKYVMKAHIKGKISLAKFWSKNQNVISGEEVLTVIPNVKSRIYGKIKLGIFKSGKVKVGQKINIKLASYPFTEYGLIEGRIKSISPITTESTYILEINLPNGLTTNYNKKIEFSYGLKGMGEIITENQRLIERFINPVKALIKNN